MNITIHRYLTSDGMYVERVDSDELTLETRLNAGKLVEKINMLLARIGVLDPKISSGFRTVEANVKAGGSKFSAHCTCEAIDLVDKDHYIYRSCITNIPLMESLGLYMEHVDHTPTWCHLTTRAPKSGKRVFIP